MSTEGPKRGAFPPTGALVHGTVPKETAPKEPELSLEAFAGHALALRYQFETGEGDEATNAAQSMTDLRAQNPTTAAAYDRSDHAR